MVCIVNRHLYEVNGAHQDLPGGRVVGDPGHWEPGLLAQAWVSRTGAAGAADG